RLAHVELEHAVAAQQQPVAAAVEHAAFHLRTLEGPATHARDAPAPIGRLAKIEDRRHLEHDLEQQFGLDLSHGVSSLNRYSWRSGGYDARSVKSTVRTLHFPNHREETQCKSDSSASAPWAPAWRPICRRRATNWSSMT